MSAHLDGMIWIKGSVDDYNKWAAVTGDEGWSYNALKPYMEKACPSSAFHPFIVADCRKG